MKNRDCRDYLKDIIDSIDDIELFTRNMTKEDIVEDKKTRNAVVRSIEVIGEAVKRIPQPVKDKNPSIPWKKMAGMRDKLIHEYFGIDYEILWKTAKDALPGLKDKFVEILAQESRG